MDVNTGERLRLPVQTETGNYVLPFWRFELYL